MITKWRAWWYDGAAGVYEILGSKDQLDHVKRHLTEQEFDILMRDWHEGFDSMRPGNHQAWRKRNHPGAQEGRLKLLQDIDKQVKAKKSFLFSSCNREVMRILKEGKTKLNLLNTVAKKWSTGLPQMDTDGKPKMRTITDSTGGGASQAPNSAVNAYSHPIQLTTTWVEVIRNILRTEKAYPKAFIQWAREDISDAFR